MKAKVAKPKKKAVVKKVVVKKSTVKEPVKKTVSKKVTKKKEPAKVKMCSLGRIDYGCYTTKVKQIPSNVRLSPMYKYVVHFDYGVKMGGFTAWTELPGRKTGVCDFTVKFPRRIRTNHMKISFLHGDDMTPAYCRELKFSQMHYIKELEFDIDLHIDDVDPKR